MVWFLMSGECRVAQMVIWAEIELRDSLSLRINPGLLVKPLTNYFFILPSTSCFWIQLAESIRLRLFKPIQKWREHAFSIIPGNR